ncbi:MAG: hypothetical protein ABII22_01030 [Candidatus Micrarchaeota archaeon]
MALIQKQGVEEDLKDAVSRIIQHGRVYFDNPEARYGGARSEEVRYFGSLNYLAKEILSRDDACRFIVNKLASQKEGSKGDLAGLIESGSLKVKFDSWTNTVLVINGKEAVAQLYLDKEGELHMHTPQQYMKLTLLSEISKALKAKDKNEALMQTLQRSWQQLVKVITQDEKSKPPAWANDTLREGKAFDLAFQGNKIYAISITGGSTDIKGNPSHLVLFAIECKGDEAVAIDPVFKRMPGLIVPYRVFQ